jgi:uncharacterized protein (TIGR03118 family)
MLRFTSLLRVGALLILASAFVLSTVLTASAQFTQTNLVTTSQDSHLANTWGIAYTGTNPFWVANEASGTSTVYDANGTIVPLVVTVPSATTGAGTPTGIVANTTTGFVVRQNGKSGAAAFIFATLDGTISGWNGSVNANNAVIALNNHATANYTGLTIATVSTNTFIYAANQAKNRIEQYNSSFHLVRTFTDTALTGMKVYGVQAIKGKIYVTFDGSGGAVDVFSTGGKLLKTLTKNASGGTLNGPWGVALAPSNFDTLSNTLLVGNVFDGKINGFNVTTGALVGTVKDKNGVAIVNNGLWGLVFGGGNSTNGNTNQLFLTAGTGGYSTGLFAVINP